MDKDTSCQAWNPLLSLESMIERRSSFQKFPLIHIFCGMQYTCTHIHMVMMMTMMTEIVVTRSNENERSHVRILSACEKTPRRQGQSLVTSVYSKHELFVECDFCSSQVYQIGVSILQIIHYNWLLLVYLPLWKNMFLPHAACPFM